MDKFNTEILNFIKFCEKIAVYNIATLSPGTRGKGSMIGEIDNFSLVLGRLYSKKPEYFMRLFKTLFSQLMHDFDNAEELISLKFLEDATLEIVAGQSGKSKIRVGFLYAKSCNICDKVSEHIEREKKTDEERQELNYPMAFIYHLFKVFDSLVVGRGDYQKNIESDCLISDKESITMINEYLAEAERFLGLKMEERNPGEMTENIQEMLKAMPKEVIREASSSTGSMPSISRDQLTAAFNGIINSGIMEKLTGCVSGAMEKGDIGGMFSGIMGLTQDPDVYKVISESLDGCSPLEEKK